MEKFMYTLLDVKKTLVYYLFEHCCIHISPVLVHDNFEGIFMRFYCPFLDLTKV